MEENKPLFGLSIDPIGSGHLSEAARWAKFLAIVGFVFVGLFAIFAVLAGTLMASAFSKYPYSNNEFGGAYAAGYSIGIIMYYLVIALLIFFAYMFLYRFSVNMKNALASEDQQALNRAFQNLKILYRYWGIITIIGLCFFIIALLFILVAGVTTGFR